MGLRKRKRDEAFPETPPSVEDIQMRENAQERARQQKIDNTIKEVLRRVNAALRSDKARYEIRGTGLHINSRLYGAEVCEYTGFSHYWVDPLLVALSKGPYKGYKVELVGLWDAPIPKKQFLW